MALAGGLLNQRDIILQHLERSENLRRKLRLGVTELTAKGVSITRSITCNNLLGQIGMAVSGLATAYLPVHCLNHLVEKQLLHRLVVTPSLPKITYKAIHRSVEGDQFMADILGITAARCDFSKWVIQ